jgi:tetratricopeptide (TPR) repeat protein
VTRRFLRSVAIFAMALAFMLFLPLASHAQRGRGSSTTSVAAPPDENDYTAWKTAKDTEQKTKLGEEFVSQYPTSEYCQEVYEDLVSTYYTKQDWNSLYATADKAISRLPNDIYILTTVGWVIPHQYNPDDPDAEKKLEKAEVYEKHAIYMIDTVPKPSKFTDEQFAAAKATFMEQAHSGLGLIYFRNQNYAEAVDELQQATQSAESQDPTDVYALAFSLEQLNRFSEAADAFQKCSVIPGPLQDRCKESADEDKTKAGAPPQ